MIERGDRWIHLQEGQQRSTRNPGCRSRACSRGLPHTPFDHISPSSKKKRKKNRKEKKGKKEKKTRGRERGGRREERERERILEEFGPISAEHGAFQHSSWEIDRIRGGTIKYISTLSFPLLYLLLFSSITSALPPPSSSLPTSLVFIYL